MLRPPWDGEFTAAFGPFRPVPRQSLLTVGRSLTLFGHRRRPDERNSLFRRLFESHLPSPAGLAAWNKWFRRSNPVNTIRW
jgi:hypothetical protein